MIPAQQLCNRHLLGEHYEIHKAVGNIRNGSGRWAAALIARGFLDPSKFESRHNELATEMFHRGMTHKSPLTFDVGTYAYLEGRQPIDVELSKLDLIDRCPECRFRIMECEKS